MDTWSSIRIQPAPLLGRTTPGQFCAKEIQKIVARTILEEGRSAQVLWVKGHAGTPGNEKADALTGRAAEKASWSPVTSMAYLKLRISDRYRASKEAWHKEPSHHGHEEIPPRKSCLGGARNSLARAAARIRTGHWCSAIYLKRIKKRTDDGCWFCAGQRKMTHSHVLLHGRSASLVAARTEAWEDRDIGGVRVLLANPRWEERLLRFLELSGVGRVVASGTDEDEAWARRMDDWIVWEVREEAVRGRR
jgi:hypothetical protein